MGGKQSRTAQVFLLMYYANDTEAFLILEGKISFLGKVLPSFPLPVGHGSHR